VPETTDTEWLSRRGTVGLITFDAPESRNALTPQSCERLLAALGEVEADPSLRCAVLIGQGGSFASGADLRAIREATPDANLAYNGQLREVVDAFAKSSTPTIAAINGYALGGGFELALACTLRVAAEDAQLGLPEVRLGLLPGIGGIQRLPRLITSGRALRLALTGARIDAAAALRFGIVEEVFAPDRLLDGALELAAEIAANAPLAVEAILAAIREGLEMDLDSALDGTEARLPALLSSDDLAEGIDAFLERRSPQFVGR
jgi:enoyl-CoA hydratase/carnithine racemase